MNRYRFYITALSSRVEVHPLNHWKTSLVDERQEGPRYRRRFNGTLTFTDNNGSDDFSLLYLIEAATPCERVILEIEEKDSGENTYHNYWTGHFSTSDGTFDLDRCTFEITPLPYDDYFLVDVNGDTQFNILDAGLDLVEVIAGDYTYDRNLWLMDVVEYLAGEVFGTVTLTSWFFQNENNPVLGGANQYRNLTIAQKSDIKRPTSSNPATVGMMSFNEMMDILKMYNVFWTFDGTTLRIEHYDFWEGEAGLDLRTNQLSSRQNKYSYLKDDMPKYEKFAFMEGGDGNYIEHTISYDSPCVDPKLTTEYRNNVTTDLSYIQTCMGDPELIANISDEGWVILGTFEDTGVNYVYYGTSYGSFMASYNYVNSWAQLIRSFFMHGRVLLSGYINGSAYDFISSRKTKQQEIKAVICYEDNYHPEDIITTELGETWLAGQKATVRQATIHPDGSVEFTLLYGEDKNEDVELPEKIKTIHCIIDESFTVIKSLLSEPNTVDTYYWVWFNDDADPSACQEVIIPAGTVYQEDLIIYPNPVVSVKFNVSHYSLDGWVFVYNDNDDVNHCDDGDCGDGGDPPPAIPAATTMIAASQLSTCAKVDVSWNASVGATYYKLFRSQDGAAFVLMDSVFGTSYEDFWAGIQDGSEFVYKVQACSGGGCSADSDTKTVITLC